MPDLARQDRRGAVGTSTSRAGRSSQPVAGRALVLVISGPSGAGKGTLIQRVLPRFPGIRTAVSATTRQRRPGEVDGRDYHFLTPTAFSDAVARGDFLEHVEYAGNRYGTLVREITSAVAAGRPVIVEIELEGARRIRELRPDAVTVFIAPPSLDELARRLTARNTDDGGEIAKRLEVGAREIAAMGEFDHRITNNDVDQATEELATIVAAATGLQPIDEVGER